MNETTETKNAPAATEPTKLSEKAQARREKEKELRKVKVGVDAKGAKLKVLAKTSPKKAGSKAREIWDLYADGLTVEDLMKKAENTKGGVSYARACLLWDHRHGFIEVYADAPAAEAPKAE